MRRLLCWLFSHKEMTVTTHTNYWCGCRYRTVKTWWRECERCGKRLSLCDGEITRNGTEVEQ